MTADDLRQWRRWVIFNLIGLLGFAIQLAVLFVLKHVFGLQYLVATAVAVEVAVLHNFIWHEHVTWAGVISPLQHGVTARLLRFHLANGLISIGGNLALTWIFVQFLHISYLPANAISVLICAALNFLASHHFVFYRKPIPPAP
jgi:putative flippase GtrA